MRGQTMLPRVVVAALMATIAAFFVFLGGAIISNVFDEYKDSDDAAYIFLGGLNLLAGVVFAAAAVLVLTGASTGWWLILAPAALVVAAMPYGDWFGTPGYAMNALLGGLALFIYLQAARRTPAG